MIPPQADAEFFTGMELMLRLYAKAYDTRFPVMAMDEQPLQLLKETRQPISAPRHHPKRIDHEYERAGVVCMFLFCEPLAGWRLVTARPRRTKIDWAHEVADLLRGR